MKGILLIALGHPNYGNMALNLAISLKNLSPEIPIALVYTESSISKLKHRPIEKYFDKLIPAPPCSYTCRGHTEYLKAKTWMYRLSPWDKTLFLDVDMIWLNNKPVSQLFNELEGVPFTFSNRGYLDMEKAEENDAYSYWCNVNEVKQVYGIQTGKYYSLQSELVYFEKSEENKAYFERAINIYDEPGVKAFNFANGIPDELAFSIACILENRYPHTTPFVPVYWEWAEKDYKLPFMVKDFYGYSAGGATFKNIVKGHYDTLARWHFQKAGQQYPYLLTTKRSYLPERVNS